MISLKGAPGHLGWGPWARRELGQPRPWVLAHPEGEWGWFPGGTLAPSARGLAVVVLRTNKEAPTMVALDGPRASCQHAFAGWEGHTATTCSASQVNNPSGERSMHQGRRQLHGGEMRPRAATIEPLHLATVTLPNLGCYRHNDDEVTEGANAFLLLCLHKVCPKWATRLPRRRRQGRATGEGDSDCWTKRAPRIM